MIALDALEADNYLSETRFVNCMIRFRAACGMGPVKIMSELQYKHHIAKGMITRSESWMAMDWLALAHDVYNKKYGENPSQHSKDKVTQLRFLQQRGFTNDQIYKVIKL
jgi:regulatory protein